MDFVKDEFASDRFDRCKTQTEFRHYYHSIAIVAGSLFLIESCYSSITLLKR